MINQIKRTLGVLAIASAFTVPIHADNEEPIIEIHSQLYEMYGASNGFYLELGAIEDTYVEVNFGYGMTEYFVEYANFDSTEGALQGTTIVGQVGPEGIVRVYGDPKLIDYVDIYGTYSDELDISKLTNLCILDVRHNKLKELDLSPLENLMAIYVDANPYDSKPLVVGPNHPNLSIISMINIGELDESFTLSDYPKLQSFSAFHTLSLHDCDTSNNPDLIHLSIETTNVESLDLSNNPNLISLNIGGTKITDIDLSNNLKIQKLYCGNSGLNSEYKLKSIDLSHLEDLRSFSGSENLFTELDVSNCKKLVNISVADNLLPGIDLSNNPDLYSVDLSKNCMDFVTLPADRPTFGEYYYNQRSITIDKSFSVGSSLDLSSKLNRPGSITTAKMVCGGEEVNPEYYSYNDGVISFHHEVADSICLCFSNSAFPAYSLYTTNFVIKNAEDYGKDNPMIKFKPQASSSTFNIRIGIAGATPENPKRFSLDLGDGNTIDYYTPTNELQGSPFTVNFTEGEREITLYVPESETLTAFEINGCPLNNIDVVKAHALEYLTIYHCELPEIDLRNNSRLKILDLNSNSLESLDLVGKDFASEKVFLTKVSADNNKINKFYSVPTGNLIELSLANNQLDNIDLTECTILESLDVSGNNIAEIELDYCESLQYLDISDNQLSSISIPPYTPINQLNISYNIFPLTNLSIARKIKNCIYAPQKPWEVPAKAPCVDLSMQYVSNGKNQTEFKWYRTDTGEELSSAQISGEAGKFKFLDTSIGEVYATWTNAMYPDFEGENIYRTGNVVAAEPPTRQIASFKTTKSIKTSILLGSTIPNNYVYIDWSGDGDLTQCKVPLLSYQNFQGTTSADTEVGIFSYEEESDGISGIAIQNTPMAEIDLSKMTEAKTILLANDKLEWNKMNLPTKGVVELNLSSNNLPDMDLTSFTDLKTLYIHNCGLSEFDATPFQDLRYLSISFNSLKSLTLNNPLLWNLFADECELESLDLSNVPKMGQLYLNHNNLSALDVSMLQELRVLNINENKFSLTTLPRILSTYAQYGYSNQALYPVNVEDGCIINLSDQLMVGANRTDFRWFRNKNVWYTEEGSIEGDELKEGTDYSENDGVFTFYNKATDAICVMTNQAFPRLILISDPIDIEGSGVYSLNTDSLFEAKAFGNSIVVAGAEGNVKLYTVDGKLIGQCEASEGTALFTDLSAGIYLVNNGKNSAKVFVK